MTPLPIVHITTVHHPFDTRIFYKELKTLQAAGHDVVLIAPHDRDEVVDGITIRAIPRIDGKLRRLLNAGRHAVQLALRQDARLYHIHDPELLLWSQILRLRGRRVVYDMHENVPLDLRHKSWIPALMRGLLTPVYRLFERLLIRNMPVIFAEDSYIRDYRWVSRHQIVVRNLPRIDELLAVDETRHSTPTVGYVGDVKPWRGSLVTLQALALLKQRGWDVGWECVGPVTDDHRTHIERYAHQHNLHGVRLHGRLLASEWHPIMARCHLGLAVLAPLPNHIQSYPTKLFEYMALGLPVIASGFPLYRQIVEGVGCGLTVNDPTDPHELAETMLHLLEHSEEARIMGQRGREAVKEQYRWEAEGKKLIEFYDAILK